MVDEEPPPDQPADETARFPVAPDETAPQPRADGTAVLPQAQEPEGGARWSARAGVPPAGPRPATVHEQQWVPERAPSGTWWLPIVIGLAALLLLGLIGLGMWLALRGSGPAPRPSATPSASVTSASPSPSPSPSASPSPSPSAVVPVPALARVVNRVTDAVPAGTVIDTDPTAGTRVPVGSTVTVFVATPPPTSTPPSPTGSG
ncbi:MAG: PASTA domain-containing protein [Actinobacteria bacterium]|nr:MAG: PASTA domain-containing protein [Actinomycetota bacterium]